MEVRFKVSDWLCRMRPRLHGGWYRNRLFLCAEDSSALLILMEHPNNGRRCFCGVLDIFHALSGIPPLSSPVGPGPGVERQGQSDIGWLVLRMNANTKGGHFKSRVRRAVS